MEIDGITQISLIGILALSGVISIAVLIGTAFIVRKVYSYAQKMSGQDADSKRLKATGEAAQATILNVKRTGTTINDDPVVEILLNVQPAARPAYQAQVKTLVSAFKIYQVQVGAVVPVKIDRSNPQTVALDFDVA